MGSAHNVKEVTDLLAIENVVEFSHDNLGAGSTWGRERSSRRAYYSKMNAMYSESPNMAMEDRMERKRQFADQHSELRFLVTRVGCGVAGYSVREVAPLFKGCISLENVALPSDFWDVLGLKLNL